MRERAYGIAEIAEALGARPATVAQWHYRGRLPPPTWRLAMGPVWVAKDIETWLRTRRPPVKTGGDSVTVRASP